MQETHACIAGYQAFLANSSSNNSADVTPDDIMRHTSFACPEVWPLVHLRWAVSMGPTTWDLGRHICDSESDVGLARFEALGGERFHPRTDLNKEDWKAVDSWIVGVLAGLSQLELEPVSHLGGGCPGL